MTTAATSLLGLALPVTGELSGTWGDTVNNAITSLLDTAIAGTTTLSTDADVTLTTTTFASNQARQAILLWNASGTVTRTITAPAQSKIYVVHNKTGSTQSIKLVGAGPTTGVTIVANESAVCAWNGSDFVKIASTAAVSSFSAGTTGLTPSTSTTGAVTLAGTLANTNGGTGQSSAFTQYGITYASTTTALATTAAGTTTTVLHGNASGAPTWSAISLSADVTGTLSPANGGTGVANNSAMTVTGSGNFAYTRTLTGTTNVTFPTTGTLATLAGSETFTNKTLTNPTVTNYVESVVAIGNSSTSKTLDLTNGTVQTVTMTGNCTFTMPTATAGKSFILIVSTGAGSFTGTFTSVKWPSNTAPTLTTTASRWDILTFVADGTYWYGNSAQAYA